MSTESQTIKLRLATERQRTHPEGCAHVTEYTLGLRRKDNRTPDPLYYSGRPKELGAVLYWAWLVSTNTVLGMGQPRKNELITYHPDEIGTLYADAPDSQLVDFQLTTGSIFPYIVKIGHLPKLTTLPQVLHDVMHRLNLTQTELATRLDLPKSRINEFINAKRPLTLTLAQKLYQLGDVAADTILNLQS